MPDSWLDDAPLTARQRQRQPDQSQTTWTRPPHGNYYAGSPLNRVSFLRTDHLFLHAALTHRDTRFVLFRDLAPLLEPERSERDGGGDARGGTEESAEVPAASLAKDPKSYRRLARIGLAEITDFIGEDRFLKAEADVLRDEFGVERMKPLIVFLGLYGSTGGRLGPAGGQARLDTSDSEKEQADAQVAGEFQWQGRYRGVPYFAVDVTPRVGHEEAATRLIDAMIEDGLAFVGSRSGMRLADEDAAIFAHARALIDWNNRNPFCAGCGRPTISIHAGAKRVCQPPSPPTTTTTPSTPSTPPSPSHSKLCPTHDTISNLTFPRTDAVAIMCILSRGRTHALLARQARYPPTMYSVLAGFIEPGESVEEAVAREVWEESRVGVDVASVQVLATQPWPFPANLMIGCVGVQAAGDHGGEEEEKCPPPINVAEGDGELVDARWVALGVIRRILMAQDGLVEGDATGDDVEATMTFPPATAIANRLLRAVVDGNVKL